MFGEEVHAGGRHVQGHDLQSSGLLVERLGDLMVGLLDQGSESGSSERVSIRRLPQSGDGRLLTNHLVLEVSAADSARELRQEARLKVSALDAHVGKAESEVNILAELDEVDDGEPEGVQ